MQAWNFGVVGAGVIADFHAKAIAEIANARLLGFCDSGSGRAKSLADKYDCRAYRDCVEMVNDPQIHAITIATPSGAHLEPAIAAAQARKHVICEKPLEITLERIDAMIQAHKTAGTMLGCIFQNRFTPAMKPLREAIAEGRFGKVTYAGIYVPWWRSDQYYRDTWHGTWKLDGGAALMNQAIHMVDMLCDLMPPVEAVQAFTAALAHDIEAEDTAVAVLRFVTGALGVIYGTTASWPGQLKRFEITGTQGTAVYLEDSFTVWQFAQQRPRDEHIRRQFSAVGGSGGAADPAAIGHQKHTRNIKAFIDALDSNKPFALTAEEGRKAVALVLAVYESSREGRLVRLIR